MTGEGIAIVRINSACSVTVTAARACARVALAAPGGAGPGGGGLVSRVGGDGVGVGDHGEEVPHGILPLLEELPLLRERPARAPRPSRRDERGAMRARAKGRRTAARAVGRVHGCGAGGT